MGVAMHGLREIADSFPVSVVDDPVARFSIGSVECVVLPSVRSHHNAVQCAGTFTIAGQSYDVLYQSGLAPADPIELLTPRELEIALLVAAGYDTKTLARRLRISFHTVRVHIGRIYTKLGLHKQTELASRMTARFRKA